MESGSEAEDTTKALSASTTIRLEELTHAQVELAAARRELAECLGALPQDFTATIWPREGTAQQQLQQHQQRRSALSGAAREDARECETLAAETCTEDAPLRSERSPLRFGKHACYASLPTPPTPHRVSHECPAFPARPELRSRNAVGSSHGLPTSLASASRLFPHGESSHRFISASDHRHEPPDSRPLPREMGPGPAVRAADTVVPEPQPELSNASVCQATLDATPLDAEPDGISVSQQTLPNVADLLSTAETNVARPSSEARPPYQANAVSSTARSVTFKEPAYQCKRSQEQENVLPRRSRSLSPVPGASTSSQKGEVPVAGPLCKTSMQRMWAQGSALSAVAREDTVKCATLAAADACTAGAPLLTSSTPLRFGLHPLPPAPRRENHGCPTFPIQPELRLQDDFVRLEEKFKNTVNSHCALRPRTQADKAMSKQNCNSLISAQELPLEASSLRSTRTCGMESGALANFPTTVVLPPQRDIFDASTLNVEHDVISISQETLPNVSDLRQDTGSVGTCQANTDTNAAASNSEVKPPYLINAVSSTARSINFKETPYQCKHSQEQGSDIPRRCRSLSPDVGSSTPRRMSEEGVVPVAGPLRMTSVEKRLTQGPDASNAMNLFATPRPEGQQSAYQLRPSSPVRACSPVPQIGYPMRPPSPVRACRPSPRTDIACGSLANATSRSTDNLAHANKTLFGVGATLPDGNDPSVTRSVFAHQSVRSDTRQCRVPSVKCSGDRKQSHAPATNQAQSVASPMLLSSGPLLGWSASGTSPRAPYATPQRVPNRDTAVSTGAPSHQGAISSAAVSRRPDYSPIRPRQELAASLKNQRIYSSPAPARTFAAGTLQQASVDLNNISNRKVNTRATTPVGPDQKALSSRIVRPPARALPGCAFNSPPKPPQHVQSVMHQSVTGPVLHVASGVHARNAKTGIGVQHGGPTAVLKGHVNGSAVNDIHATGRGEAPTKAINGHWKPVHEQLLDDMNDMASHIWGSLTSLDNSQHRDEEESTKLSL